MILGIDVSNNNNHAGPINWAEVARTRQFCWSKVSEGLGFVDPFYRSNRDGARAAGMFSGGYHMLRPGQDGGAQAKQFADLADLTRCNLPPMLDAEQAGCTVAQVEAFQAVLPSVLYLGEPFHGQIKVPDQWARWALMYPDYRSSEPAAPAPWLDMAVWQYAGGHGITPGVVGPCDQSMADPDWFAKVTHTPIPTPPPEDDDVASTQELIIHIGQDGKPDTGQVFRTFPDAGVYEPVSAAAYADVLSELNILGFILAKRQAAAPGSKFIDPNVPGAPGANVREVADLAAFGDLKSS